MYRSPVRRARHHLALALGCQLFLSHLPQDLYLQTLPLHTEGPFSLHHQDVRLSFHV